MYSLVALVHLDGDDAGAVTAALSALGGVVAPVLEGAFNGGDLSSHFGFADEAAYRALRPAIDAVLNGPGVARADTCFFRHGKSGIASPGLSSGVYRALFQCAEQNASAERLAQFEAEMVLMPKYIPAIRNWRLSEVIEASGELPWTHVWEQEYEDVGGLLGPYMIHPYHWAFIDRWYDHESPDWLFNVKLCHSFCAFGQAVLS